MKAFPSKRLSVKLIQLASDADLDVRLNTYLLPELNNASYLRREFVESMRETFKKQQNSPFSALSDEQMTVAMYVQAIHSNCDGQLFLNNQEEELVMNEIVKYAKEFSPDFLTQNPYYRNVYVPVVTSGKFSFDKGTIYEFEMFNYQSPHSTLEHGKVTLPSIGYFNENVEYPVLRENMNNTAWMTITPNEICTMEKPVSNASGKVLTLGLGLGYFAYMAARKDSVSSVTVIEREQAVIDLFEENLRKQMECADKITIIHTDAYEYLDSVKDGEYDYCFADIWKTSADLYLYMPMRLACRKFHKTKVDYWINDSFLMYLKTFVYAEIMYAMYKAFQIQNVNVPSTLAEDNDWKNGTQYFHQLLNKYEIKTPEDIDKYLSNAFIDNLIKKANIPFYR